MNRQEAEVRSRRAGLLALLGVGLVSVCFARPPDPAHMMMLILTNGPGPGEVTLSWNGEGETCHVHRWSQPTDAYSPGNFLAVITTDSFVDTGDPAPGEAFFYRVVEGVCGDAIVDPGEGCDDGNVAPDDGCSEDCQFE